MTQDAFAEMTGVSKRALANYESGDRKPDSDFLAALAAHGIDVTWLLTGQRPPTSHLSVVPTPPPRPDSPPPNAEEARLLSDFRLCDAQGREIIKATSRAAAQAARAPAPSRSKRRSG